MRFAYRAKQDLNTETSGVVEAADLSSAIVQVKRLRLYPVEVTPVEPQRTPALAQHQTPQRSLSRKELALWAQMVGEGLASGLSLTQALHLLAEQEAGRPSGEVAAALETQICEGVHLADAMGSDPPLFSPLAISLVRAGEASGTLEQVLGALAEQTEAEANLLAKVQAALVYPAFVLIIGGVTVVLLMTFVVPKLALLFSETGQPLPWMTRWMIEAGSRWAWGLGGAGLVFWAGSWLHRQGRLKLPVKRWAVICLSKLPLLGRLLAQAQMARLCSALGLLLEHGLPLPEALRLSGATLGTGELRSQLQEIEREVIEGMPLASSFRRSGMAEPLLVTLLAMGEARGDLAGAFGRAAGQYRQRVNRTVQALSVLIEPAMILGVGLVVGTIVFSMLMPIFQLDFNVR